MQLLKHPNDLISASAVQSAFSRVIKAFQEQQQAKGKELANLYDYDALIAADEPEHIEKFQKARKYAKRLGLFASKQDDGNLGTFFVNGRVYAVDEVSRPKLMLP